MTPSRWPHELRIEQFGYLEHADLGFAEDGLELGGSVDHAFVGRVLQIRRLDVLISGLSFPIFIKISAVEKLYIPYEIKLVYSTTGKSPRCVLAKTAR